MAFPKRCRRCDWHVRKPWSISPVPRPGVYWLETDMNLKGAYERMVLSRWNAVVTCSNSKYHHLASLDLMYQITQCLLRLLSRLYVRRCEWYSRSLNPHRSQPRRLRLLLSRPPIALWLVSGHDHTLQHSFLSHEQFTTDAIKFTFKLEGTTSFESFRDLDSLAILHRVLASSSFQAVQHYPTTILAFTA